MPPKLAFIPADEKGKTTAKDRKLVRSHCMLGKNQRKYPYQGDRHYRDGKRKKAGKPQTDAETSIVALRPTNDFEPKPPPPKGTPSVFSLAIFAREIDSYSRDLLYRYFFVARDVFYPVQFCTYSDASVQTWFQWLLCDAAYLESALMGMSAMDDFFHGRSRPSKLTISHLKATITLLNSRLSDPELCLADSTVAVVMGLAELSGYLYDDAATKAHLAGFQQMVRLRGGVGGFRENTKLQIKIGRFDLAYALKTGKQPQFYMDPISWSPIFEPTERSTRATVAFITSPKLLGIFHDLVQFTSILNTSCSLSSDSPQPILMDTQYLNIIGSIQYRLLCLENELGTILDEAVRLGMLGLLTTTFQVAGQRARYPHLEERLRAFCKALPVTDRAARRESVEHDGELIPPEAVVWLLLVGALAVLNIAKHKQERTRDDGGEDKGAQGDPDELVDDKAWMVEVWRRQVPTEWWGNWEASRRMLEPFPWVEVIHEQPARAIFEVLSSGAKDSRVQWT